MKRMLLCCLFSLSFLTLNGCGFYPDVYTDIYTGVSLTAMGEPSTGFLDFPLDRWSRSMRAAMEYGDYYTFRELMRTIPFKRFPLDHRMGDGRSFRDIAYQSPSAAIREDIYHLDYLYWSVDYIARVGLSRYTHDEWIEKVQKYPYIIDILKDLTNQL